MPQLPTLSANFRCGGASAKRSLTENARPASRSFLILHSRSRNFLASSSHASDRNSQRPGSVIIRITLVGFYLVQAARPNEAATATSKLLLRCSRAANQRTQKRPRLLAHRVSE